MTSVKLTITFPFGSMVRLSAIFTRAPTQAEIDDETACDAADWQPVDPETVSLKVKDPALDVEFHDYIGSPADITRDGVGLYHFDLTPDQVGKWYYRWESTGLGQAANESGFIVAATEFAP